MSPMVKSIIKGAVDAIPETVEVAALTIPSAISDKLCDLLGGGEAAKPKADLARHALAAALVDFLRTCTGQE
jgi:hypothetical protein